jgi:site-specific recombinase XerD
VRPAIREYLAQVAALNRSSRTVGAYRQRLSYFAAFARRHGAMKVRDLTVGLVREYHDEVSCMKGWSVKAYLRTVAAFLRWCHERGKILTDIASRLEIPRTDDSLPPRPLTPGEVARLIDQVPTATVSGKRNRTILEVLYACGLRAHELLGVDIDDVNFDEGTLLVHGKGQKDRLMPIHQTALRAAREYLAARGGRPRRRSPLFLAHRGTGGRERRLGQNALAAVFRMLNERCSKHVHPHLLRHSFAVHLLQGGADLRYVQALLGHTSPDTTSRYLRIVKEELKRSYDSAIEAIFDAAAAQRSTRAS